MPLGARRRFISRSYAALRAATTAENYFPAPEFPPLRMSDVGQQKRAFLDFIDQAGYLSTIQRALSRGDSRLCLNLDDLRGYDPEVTSPL